MDNVLVWGVFVAHVRTDGQAYSRIGLETDLTEVKAVCILCDILAGNVDHLKQIVVSFTFARFFKINLCAHCFTLQGTFLQLLLKKRISVYTISMFFTRQGTKEAAKTCVD